MHQVLFEPFHFILTIIPWEVLLFLPHGLEAAAMHLRLHSRLWRRQELRSGADTLALYDTHHQAEQYAVHAFV